MIKKLLILPLLLIAMTVNAEPIIRVVCTDGMETEFAVNEVHKLVLSDDNVEVVSNDGSTLLNVALSDIIRVEFEDDASTSIDVIESIPKPIRNSLKVLEHGQVYIISNGKKYTIQGVEVENTRK